MSAALDLVSTASFDLAVLDIDLHGERVTPVAEAVVRRGKPIVFLTGYSDKNMLPPHFERFIRLEKPADPKRLLNAIRQALDRPHEASPR